MWIQNACLKCAVHGLLKIQDAKIQQKFAICTPLHNFACYIFAIKAYINDCKKKLLNSTMSSAWPHNMVNFDLLVAEIGWRVWVPQQISTGFASCRRYCTNVAQWRLTKLYRTFGLVHYIYIFGGTCPPNGILRGAKFTLRPSLAFSYIGSVTVSHLSSELCGIQQRATPIYGRVAITLSINSHSSYVHFMPFCYC